MTRTSRRVAEQADAALQKAFVDGRNVQMFIELLKKLTVSSKYLTIDDTFVDAQFTSHTSAFFAAQGCALVREFGELRLKRVPA